MVSLPMVESESGNPLLMWRVQGPLELTLSPTSLLCLPASPSPQQLLLRSQVSFTWIWPCGQMEEAICPLPRLSLP